MLKKKLAHNSTIPSIGGNHDLKPLQNLIAAEKAVLISCVLRTERSDFISLTQELGIDCKDSVLTTLRRQKR